jgi:hypothetical protein
MNPKLSFNQSPGLDSPAAATGGAASRPRRFAAESGGSAIIEVADTAGASAPLASPALQGTSAGTVLQQAEKGTSAASSAGRTIDSNAAAINYPTVDSAFASGDGIAVPDIADQAPGKERLTHPFEQGGVFAASGAVRVKRLIGSGVFTSAGERLGTVRDVLLNEGGEPQVILEADGRKVEVPWSKVEFALPGNELHGTAVLPGMTHHTLEELPEFRPQDQRGGG